MSRFTEACQWLENVPRFGVKDGLNNMFRLMDRLGDPQKSLKVIHVAGTNGKGSCCAMMQQILLEAGYTVGLYTSPHLVDYRERIRVGVRPDQAPGEDQISEEDFVRLLDLVRGVNDRLVEEGFPHATFFEFLTAMAYVYFAEQGVDYAVLETGVGGRLDATNIVEQPVLCMITSISLDHTKTLGSTIGQIAGEKAGIIKPGVPVVVSHNGEEAIRVIRQKAVEKDSPCILAPDDTDLSAEAALQGSYQQENIAAVITAVEALRSRGVRIPREAVERGLKHVRWPGRMQRIVLSEDPKRVLLLDGAHNPDAAERLGRYLRSLEEPVDLLFAALNKKDIRGVLKGLLIGSQKIRHLLYAPIEGADCLTAEALQELLCELGEDRPVEVFDSVEKCLASNRSSCLVAAGSLYLVGEVLKVVERK